MTATSHPRFSGDRAPHEPAVRPWSSTAALLARALSVVVARAVLALLMLLLRALWRGTRLCGRALVVSVRRPHLRWIPAGLAALLVLAVLGAGTGYRYRAWDGTGSASVAVPSDLASAKRMLAKLQVERSRHLATLSKYVPHGVYVVVDQTHNRLYLKRDENVELTAICSAGSGYVLKEGGGDRKWVFDTPRGLFHIHNRIEDPAWRRPDWAFIEEGKPIPKDPSDRLEFGSMGEYAFDLGHGYFIHGTLYERLLGRSVTHGCIRLGRDDLRKVAQAVRIGTSVYIY